MSKEPGTSAFATQNSVVSTWVSASSALASAVLAAFQADAACASPAVALFCAAEYSACAFCRVWLAKSMFSAVESGSYFHGASPA